MNLFKTIAISIIVISINACSTNTTEIPKGEFATGVIIVNEGNFGTSNGSVGYFNEVSKSATQDIFEVANGVSSGGNIQSVYFYENRAFILDQLGNRIEVVEAETFKTIATVDLGLNTPRYMIVENGKGYITNWGTWDGNTFTYSNPQIVVLNINTYSVTKTIPVSAGPEGLFAFGGNVYVANSFTNSIEIINTGTDEIIDSIEISQGPLNFVNDKNGKVWVLSSDFYTGAVLSQIDLSTELILKSFGVSEGAKSLNINGAGDQLYYLSTPFGADALVKTVPISATEDAPNALITAPNIYGMGVDPVNDIIYLGNHNGFQGNGTVIRYEGETLLDSYAAGIAPNGFVFRK